MFGTTQSAMRASFGLRNAAVACCALLLGLALGELALRAVGQVDENGQWRLRGRRIRPYALPVATATGDGEDEVSICIVFPSATTSKTERRRITEAMRAGTNELARVIADPHVFDHHSRAKSNAA